ncbi:MAG: DNA polymerase III subunit [Patescibacteria group bacterium]
MKFHWSGAGHTIQKRSLEHAVANDRLVNTYLFLGPAHVGKASVAMDFAKILLCDADDKPCGKCEFCRQSLSASPDFYFLDHAGTISVDQIRALKTKFSFRPFSNSKKIAIIANAENLDAQASNALLKILEEPPEQTFFILCCAKANVLPATISSRAVKLNFTYVSNDEISAVWGNDKKLSKAISRSYGRPGLIQKMVDDTEFMEFWQESEKNLQALFSATDLEKLQISSSLAELETEELGVLLEQWLIHLDAKLSGLEKTSEFENLGNTIKAIIDAAQNLRMNANKRMLLDNLVLQFRS